MNLTLVNINRSTTPTGVCISTYNYIKILSSIPIVSRIHLIIGKWQLPYYKFNLGIENISKVDLIIINEANNSFSRNIWFLTKMRNYVTTTDLIILCYPIPFFNIFFKCPIVTILHDLYPFEYPANFGYPTVYFNKLFFLINLLNTNFYMCVSNTTKKSFNSLFGKIFNKSKIQTIYNFIPVCSSNFVNPIRELISQNFWLAVGQHRKNKNLDCIIEVFYNSLQNNILDNSTYLVIVGANGPETKKILSMINSFNIIDRVLLLSNLTEGELNWLMSNNSLFLTASTIEGFNIPLVEAGLNSSKIIASDIPIHREIISNIEFFSLEGNIQKNLNKSINNILNVNLGKPQLNNDLRGDCIYEKLNKFLHSFPNNL